MPVRRSWRRVPSFGVVILVTSAALDGSYAIALRTTMHVHCVSVTVIALPGKISAGVAVHAARLMEHRQQSFESSGRRSIVTRSGFVDVRAILTGGDRPDGEEKC